MVKERILVVGIDGGGTKSVGCLLNGAGRLLARALGPPTNYVQAEETMIAERLLELAQRLAQAAQIEQQSLSGVAVCLSGLGQESARRRMYDSLVRTGAPGTLVVESDARAALEGAFGGGDGIILIAGTGSIAFGKCGDQRIERAGGWGYLLGDEGSGFEIGRSAVAAALRERDGRGPATSLRQRLEAFFHVEDIQLIVPRIYAEYATRGDLAQFAPMVFEEAAAGDAVAENILREAGRQLAALITALARRLNFGDGIPVALMGNIFKATGLVIDTLRNTLATECPSAQFISPRFPAEVGAALLALRTLGHPLDEQALEALGRQLS